MPKLSIILASIGFAFVVIPDACYADNKPSCETPIDCFQKSLEKLDQAREFVKAQQAQNQLIHKQQQAKNERLLQKALEKLEQARELAKAQQAKNQRILKQQQAKNEQLLQKALKKLEQAQELVKAQQAENARLLKQAFKQQELARELVKAQHLENKRFHRKVEEIVTPVFFHDRLKDGTLSPEMIWIYTGQFRMGDIQAKGHSDERPIHEVLVNRFAIGRYEVTFAEYDRFATATGRKKPNDNGWGRGKRPVINVSWEDATAYAKWLSQQTGKQYRLPTEAEWEYSARSGTKTAYWWGNQVESNLANCDGCGSYWDNDKTAKVGSFSPNAFGLYDTVGNVGEWLCSAYEYKYNGKEQQCLNKNRFQFRVIRGGSWNSPPKNVRSASRSGNSVIYRNNRVGFRLAREM
jgi:formylglycine-generating enzyme required for sulfatase activity